LRRDKRRRGIFRLSSGDRQITSVSQLARPAIAPGCVRNASQAGRRLKLAYA
jgi:hypothetical protein